jgi:hypothetical protein
MGSVSIMLSRNRTVLADFRTASGEARGAVKASRAASSREVRVLGSRVEGLLPLGWRSNNRSPTSAGGAGVEVEVNSVWRSEKSEWSLERDSLCSARVSGELWRGVSYRCICGRNMPRRLRGINEGHS